LIPISQDPCYARLKEHLIATTGLAFYADRDERLTELIASRLSTLGMRDCSCYTDFLADWKQGSAEMDVLIARLTIGETYFFRDEAQFDAIRNIILPDILERNQSSKRLRIWSAGCATGQEPYSLAIMLARDFADRIAGWRVGIDATDLNRGYLVQAAEGKFRAWAFRSTSDEVKRECFSKDGLIWTIHPRYKRWISFQHMNLVEREFATPWPDGTLFDLILCRNVMIYFAPEVNRRLIGQLHNSLGDDGWLVVGAAEHGLDGYQAFRTSDVAKARIYQKLPPPSVALEVTRLEETQEPVTVAPEPLAERKVIAALPPPAGLWIQPPVHRDPVAEPARADLEGLRQLADQGDWQRAAEYGQTLLSRDGLNPQIHFYQALICENLGRAAEAQRWLRQAIYLDRNFALAHYQLGLALERDRQMPAAARSFENVLKVLGCAPDDAIVTAGSGVTATGLKELARTHLLRSGPTVKSGPAEKSSVA
jgi:chemotaxis protein methyltransferase CheR